MPLDCARYGPKMLRSGGLDTSNILAGNDDSLDLKSEIICSTMLSIDHVLGFSGARCLVPSALWLVCA